MKTRATVQKKKEKIITVKYLKKRKIFNFLL